MPSPRAVRRSFLIALVSASLWSCPGQNDSEPPPEPPPIDDEVSLPAEATVDVDAGQLRVAAVQNSQAEILWVVFPRGSVEAPAQVTVRTADIQVTGLPDDAIIAAFEIEGIDDRLARKAQLFFDAAPESQLPANAAAFFLKPNGRLELLPSQESADTTLSADLYHFSELVIAAPDAEGFGATVEPALAEADAPPASISELAEKVQSNLEFAEQAQQLGLDELAEEAMESAQESLESQIEEELADEPDDPCGDYLADGLELLVNAQLLGIDDDVIDRWNAELNEKASECLHGGEIVMTGEVFDDSYYLEVECPDPIPFIPLDDGRLIGGGRQTCTIDERWEYADPESGSGTLIFDAKLTHDWSLEGEYTDLSLLFEPPLLKPVQGYLKVSVAGPEGESTLLDIEITETTGTVDLEREGLTFLSLAVPIGEAEERYRPGFALQHGAVFYHTERFDNTFVVISWILYLDVDDCDRQKIEDQCQREKAEMIRACSALEDWMVVSTIGADGDQVITCGTADCSDAIDASEQRGDDPFTSIQKTLDKQCDNSEPIICQLECYGWSP